MGQASQTMQEENGAPGRRTKTKGTGGRTAAGGEGKWVRCPMGRDHWEATGEKKLPDDDRKVK